MPTDSPLAYSIVICTYARVDMCRQTVTDLLPLMDDRGEIVIVDQAAPNPSRDLYCDPGVRAGQVRYFHRAAPNLVKARNTGVQQARGEIVLFVDDDVKPAAGLLEGHLKAYLDPAVGAVAGRILSEQFPAAEKLDPRALDSRAGWWFTNFDHRERVELMTARGCNMSFRRRLLIEAGGFDTFLKPPFSFREDSDVSMRVRKLGYKLVFSPEAELIHLDAPRGGTRGVQPKRGPVAAEWFSYRRYFWHYRDNLYFIVKHFSGAEQWRWVWTSYRAYVGLSRWPWRLLAKNFCFLLALARAHYLVLATRPPYFEPVNPS